MVFLETNKQPSDCSTDTRASPSSPSSSPSSPSSPSKRLIPISTRETSVAKLPESDDSILPPYSILPSEDTAGFPGGESDDPKSEKLKPDQMYLVDFVIYDVLQERLAGNNGAHIDLLFSGVFKSILNGKRFFDIRTRIFRPDEELQQIIRSRISLVEEKFRSVMTRHSVCPLERSELCPNSNNPSDSETDHDKETVDHVQRWIYDERNDLLELMLRTTVLRRGETKLENAKEIVESLRFHAPMARPIIPDDIEDIEKNKRPKQDKEPSPPTGPTVPTRILSRSRTLFSSKLNQLLQRLGSDDGLTTTTERLIANYDEMCSEDQTSYLNKLEQLDCLGFGTPFVMRVIGSRLSARSKRVILERVVQLTPGLANQSSQPPNQPSQTSNQTSQPSNVRFSLFGDGPVAPSNPRPTSGHADQKIREWLKIVETIPFDVVTKLPFDVDPSAEAGSGHPIRSIRTIRTLLKECRENIEKKIYGHSDAKAQLMRILSTTICVDGTETTANTTANTTTSPTVQNRPDQKTVSHVIGVEGPPGVGKTTLVRELVGHMLGRPLVTINLGGAHDSSFLEGHDYTYQASQPGEIVRALIAARTMNCVIYFDELDKVSRSPRGEEIVNCLMHLIDPTQHGSFRDKYLCGVELDLRGVVFVFSMNDSSAINPVLLDRMQIIRVQGYERWEKVELSKQSLIRDIEQSIHLRPGVLRFGAGTIEHIIDRYTDEGGVRRLREIMMEVMMELRLRSMEQTVVHDSAPCVAPHSAPCVAPHSAQLRAVQIPSSLSIPSTIPASALGDPASALGDPASASGDPAARTKPNRRNRGKTFEITLGMLENDLLRRRNPINREMCQDTQLIGTVNGAWASRNGVGGILPIQAVVVDGCVARTGNRSTTDSISKSRLEIELDGMSVNRMELRCTGMQGDVMKESMEVAKTVAVQVCIDRFGYDGKDIPKCIHIHCPNGGVRKDGPSAGIAIVVCIVSRLLGRSVDNRLAMTGEIDLCGNVLMIGGLQEKVFGAQRAGVRRFLYPHTNERDMSELRRKHGTNLNGIDLIPVRTIEDVVRIALF